jgi:hypothetical protein
MPAENRDARAETIQVLFPWGMPLADVADDVAGSAAWWLSGGVVLLLWTALALLLTSS